MAVSVDIRGSQAEIVAGLRGRARAHACARRSALARGPRAPDRSADVPARLGPRPHRRLRGSLARPPPRRRAAAARRPRRHLRRVRDAARGPRRHRAARHRRRARRTSPTCASARCGRSQRTASTRVLHEMVLQHEQQHTETMLQTLLLGRIEGYEHPQRRARRRRRPAGTAASSSWPSPAGSSSSARRAGRFSYDNERPRHTIARRAVPDRAHAGHQRDLARLRRGRRLRAARVVVRGGLGVEGGVRHHSPLALGAPAGRRVGRAHGARPARAGPGPAGRPRELVRGRRRGKRTRRPAPHRGRVGDGGDLGPAHAGEQRQPRPARRSTRRPSARSPAARARCGALDMLGNVWEWTATEFGGYPGFERAPVPRVLGGLLRQAATASCAAARGRRSHASPARRSATGTCPSAARSSAACGWPATWSKREHRHRPLLGTRREPFVIHSYLRPGDERTLADDVLDGLTRPFKELPPKHFYDARGADLFDRICELPEYYPTRAERSILVSRAAHIAQFTGAGEVVELGSGTAEKTRVLLAALRAAGTLRRYVPLDVTQAMVERCARELTELERRAPRARHRRRLRAPPRARPAADRGPADRRLPRRHDRQLHARRAAALPAPRRARCCGRASTTCCSAPTSSRTRASSRPRTTTRRASRRSSTATCCT